MHLHENSALLFCIRLINDEPLQVRYNFDTLTLTGKSERPAHVTPDSGAFPAPVHEVILPMRVSALLPATLLLASASIPSLALGPLVHPSQPAKHAGTQHASIKHATGHPAATTHKSIHAATIAAGHHEAIGIPSERATEIQAALIQHGYLTGEPSGAWDTQTAAAMEKLQADNGWQTKVTPDARALIKLGLGPNQQQAAAQPPAAEPK